VGMDEGLKLGVNLSYETRLGVDLDLCDLSWAGRGAPLIRDPLSARGLMCVRRLPSWGVSPEKEQPMRMTIDVELEYRLEVPGPTLLVIEAAGAMGQELHHSSIDFGPVERFARVPAEEGIGERIVLRAADQISCRYSAELTVTRERPDFDRLDAVEVDEMPGDALRYLLPSRYCQAERFANFVASRFGDINGGRKVTVMRDWIEQRLDYVAGVSTGGTTAVDTFVDRRGVCRDYAHLLVAFCRAAEIPARIASVYAPSVSPQDFHAVVEVYLDGAWHLTDPTGMATAETMAIMAVGRDATDVAFLTTFSTAELQRQTVDVRRVA